MAVDKKAICLSRVYSTTSIALGKTILQGKVEGEDHEEGQKDSSWTVCRNGPDGAQMRRGGSQRTV